MYTKLTQDFSQTDEAARRRWASQRQRDQALIARYQKNGDCDALEKLLSLYEPLIKKHSVHQYQNFAALEKEELLSEGRVGFIVAIGNYDLNRVTPVGTYAKFWIKATVNEYVLRNTSAIRFANSSDAKKAFFKIGHIKRTVETDQAEGIPLPQTLARLSTTFNIPAGIMKTAYAQATASFISKDAPIPSSDGNMTYGDVIADTSSLPEDVLAEQDELSLRREWLNKAIQRIDMKERDRYIFIQRHLTEDPKTLEELGAELGISKERVRQIDNRTFERVRELVLRQAIRAGENVPTPPRRA